MTDSAFQKVNYDRRRNTMLERISNTINILCFALIILALLFYVADNYFESKFVSNMLAEIKEKLNDKYK